VIAVLAILAIGGFLFTSTRSKKTSSNPQGSSQQANQPSSLKDLLAKGVAQTCSFSNDTNKGTVYVSGGKVRGDFDVTADGKTTKSYMIVDGNTSYIWMEGQTTGFKTTFDLQASDQPAATNAAPTESFNANQNLNYNCKPWIVNSAVFTLPAGVNFMEFGGTPTIAPSGQANPASGSTSSQCSYCNNLSGDAKAQCLTSLNCK